MRRGSFGDDDDRNEPVEGNRDADFIHTETQVFDSQFSPASSPGNGSATFILLFFLQSFVL